MNDLEWTFDGLEFRVLLEQAGRDRLPFPLQFRPTADSAADYHRRRHDANMAVAAVMDDDLRFAVHTIVEPLVRVEVVGHRRPSATETTAKIRAHAAIGYEYAALLIQQPGVDDRSGGQIAMSLIDSARAVPAALGVLPTASPGKTSRIDIDRSSSDTDSASPLLSRAGRATREEQYDGLFRQSLVSGGEVLVSVGRATDSRLQDGTTGLQWVDFEDDGRYAITHGTLLTVRPASIDDLVAEIRHLVDRARSEG